MNDDLSDEFDGEDKTPVESPKKEEVQQYVICMKEDKQNMVEDWKKGDLCWTSKKSDAFTVTYANRSSTLREIGTMFPQWKDKFVLAPLQK